MSHALDLSGKVVLVTGASQGIGEQIARTFHHAGASVVLNSPGIDQTAEDASRIAKELEKTRANSTLVVVANVAHADEVIRMMGAVRDRFGGLDFLVNNAAIIRDRSIAKMSEEEWQQVIDVDLTGVFHCCKHALPILRDGGAVVSTGSIAGLMGFYGQCNYAAAKAGVAAMMRVLSREVARRGIRVNAIAPGVIETAMSQTIPLEVRTSMLQQIPLGRFGRADEIAQVVLFLCSPMASYITGQTIEINGGWRG
jgi:3-oxoacyl-[acyl-carrier protein] reductase